MIVSISKRPPNCNGGDGKRIFGDACKRKSSEGDVDCVAHVAGGNGRLDSLAHVDGAEKRGFAICWEEGRPEGCDAAPDECGHGVVGGYVWDLDMCIRMIVCFCTASSTLEQQRVFGDWAIFEDWDSRKTPRNSPVNF